jgi:hypothetical protein
VRGFGFPLALVCVAVVVVALVEVDTVAVVLWFVVAVASALWVVELWVEPQAASPRTIVLRITSLRMALCFRL